MSRMDKYNVLDDIFTKKGSKSYHFEESDNGVSWNLRLVHTRTDETMDVRNLDGTIIDIKNIDPVWYNHTVKVNLFRDSDWKDPNHPVVCEMREQARKDNTIRLIDFCKKHNAREEESRRIRDEWWEKQLEKADGEPVYAPFPNW